MTDLELMLRAAERTHKLLDQSAKVGGKPAPSGWRATSNDVAVFEIFVNELRAALKEQTS